MSTGQAVGAVAGGAIGFFVGGPTGALYGAQIGMATGGYLDPPKGPTQSGPRLSDTSQQTSTYGATIPRVDGTIGVLGNIFWLENNKLKEVVKKKKSGGKGGGSSTTVKTYTYYGTFAVGLCEGPIAGVRRIWVGPDLIYDAGSDDLETIIASNQASSKFSIYLGTADQQPDPRMQAEMGVANCPAYRGLAYVVVKDLLLTKYGNSIQGARIKVEVVGSQSVIQGAEIITGQVGIPYILPDYFYSSASAWMAGASLESYVNIAKSQNYSGSGVMQCELVTAIKASRTVVEYTSVPGDPVSGLTYPLAGDADGPSYGFGFNSKVTIDGINYAMPLLGYFPGTCRYVKRGGAVWVFALSSPRRVTRADTGAYYEDNNVLHITSDGAVLYALLSNGTVDIRDSDTLAFIRNDNYGLPINGWSAGLSGALDGIMHRDGVLYVLRNANKTIYRIESGVISKSYVLPFSPDGSTNSWGIGNGVVAFLSGTTATITYYQLEELVPQSVPLAGIFEAECLRSKMLVSADIDVSLLTDTVSGYKVANIGSIRSAIEPLQGAFPFDVIQSGYKIKAVPRGQSSVATIDIGDLGIDEQLRQSREMDTQLPTKIVASYLDKARNYDTNEQFWERPSSGAVNTRTMELPIVMGASQALQMAERLGNLYWLERTEFGPFTLPPPFGYLEAGDVVTLHAGYADYELRLTLVNYQSDGSLACSAKLNNPSLYISQAASNETLDATTIALAGASLYALLDIPVVDETLQNSPGMVGVMTGYTNGWPGGVVYRSPDEGQTWDDIQAFSAKGTLGYARGVLGVHAGNLIDYGSTLTVDLLSGEFSAITEAQMLNGANMVAYGAHGRWEILRFAGATLNADGSRTISTLIRGDRGTEWATGLHVAGDLFVLLDDPDGAWISMPTEMIGAPRTYRGVTSGADIDSSASATLTYQGVNLECLSPVHPVGVRDGSANLAISWKRRTRVGGAWRDNVDAGLGETSEAYEIDIMSGTTVKRTLASVTPAATYTAADQTTDFGSAQSSITVRIYQLSSVVGRGYALEATL